VYAGHDLGTSCPGGELVNGESGDNVTYCLNVTNTGDTYLDNITIDDTDLGIDRTDLMLLSGSEPLAPSSSLVFYYETTITASLINTADASGNPTDSGGTDIPGLTDPSDSDTAEVAMYAPLIDIQKTVYAGHDSGGSCPGGELVVGPSGDPVTYCFTITNNGDTYLDGITIDDTDLGIDRTDLTLLSGSEPLADGASMTFYYQTTITAGLINNADTSGNPTDSGGTDIPGLTDPIDSDTAQVAMYAPGIDIQKTVYAGHDLGASCPGGELVNGEIGDDITYCFTVTNTGDTYLDGITIDDTDLGIDRTDLTLLSGSEPLADGASMTFYYPSIIIGDLTNTADASGNPTDSGGTDIPGLTNPTDSDTAQVAMYAPGIDIQKTVYAGHDSGASCPGGELVVGDLGGAVTYCFAVTNNGDTYLDDITIDDTDLGIDRTDLTPLSVSEPLADGASISFYYQTTISGDLVNTADASGNPTDSGGADIPGLTDPIDSDTSQTELAVIIEDPKTDFLKVDADGSGDFSPGDRIEYTVVITNIGSGTAEDVFYTDTIDLNTNLVCSETTTSQGTITCPDGDPDTFSVNVGDIDGGTSVTITFQVTIDRPLAAGVTQVSNQGWVSGSNFDTKPTDDPAAPGEDDPTITPVKGVAIDPALKTSSLIADLDGNGGVSSGDILLYQVTFWNNGNMDATGVIFTDTPDPHTRLVAGTVVTTKGSVTRGNTDGDTSVEVYVGDVQGYSLEMITISFQVSVGSLPGYVHYIYNQGVVSSNEESPVLTDDPTTLIDGDRTRDPAAYTGAVPVFPSIYMGIVAALGAGILGYFIRRRLTRQE
jgi:uncharacterized repeat protein (TIGR01451 family)